MSWFSVLKGAYPSLQQIDKTLPVASGTTGIVRGSLIYESNGTWLLATATQVATVTAYIHFALMAQTDLTAGMAGSVGAGAPNTIAYPAVAKVTGLAVGMPMEFETSEFVKTAVYTVGQLLAVANGGKLTAHNSGNNCIAQVTKASRVRWVNDAIAVTGYRTGANVDVLTARTLWIPKLVS
jgi:hypothetical protein